MSDMAVEAQAETARAEALALNLEERVVDFISGNSSLAVMQGITADEMEAVYTVAYNLYGSGKYSDASELFRFLCLHGHLEPRYWMGLGASEQVAGRLPEAIQAYSVCAVLDEADPQPSLRAGECFRQMGNDEGAQKAMEACIDIADARPEYQAYTDRARLILNAIKTKSIASNAVVL